jgi:hypothetical protein
MKASIPASGEQRTQNTAIRYPSFGRKGAYSRTCSRHRGPEAAEGRRFRHAPRLDSAGKLLACVSGGQDAEEGGLCIALAEHVDRLDFQRVGSFGQAVGEFSFPDMIGGRRGVTRVVFAAEPGRRRFFFVHDPGNGRVGLRVERHRFPCAAVQAHFHGRPFGAGEDVGQYGGVGDPPWVHDGRDEHVHLIIGRVPRRFVADAIAILGKRDIGIPGRHAILGLAARNLQLIEHAAVARPADADGVKVVMLAGAGEPDLAAEEQVPVDVRVTADRKRMRPAADQTHQPAGEHLGVVDAFGRVENIDDAAGLGVGPFHVHVHGDDQLPVGRNGLQVLLDKAPLLIAQAAVVRGGRGHTGAGRRVGFVEFRELRPADIADHQEADRPVFEGINRRSIGGAVLLLGQEVTRSDEVLVVVAG